MFIKLLKKEIKQFLRSKSNLIMLFLFPVILITTLSFGLKSLMENTSDKFASLYCGDTLLKNDVFSLLLISLLYFFNFSVPCKSELGNQNLSGKLFAVRNKL